MRILLAEDDWRVAESLETALSDQHYSVDIATDGQAGWEFVRAFVYDLLLLDVMMPKLGGLDLCRQLRSQGYHMPILLLTARDTTADQVTGLDAGADDYVVKPYKVQELSARIRALVRRGSSALPPVMDWGSLRLDPNTCEAIYGDRSLPLTPKEYRLLELFLRHSGRVLSRNVILDNLWSAEEPPEEDSVKALIKRLRQKLKGAGAPSDFIETSYGLGYRLKRNL